MSFEELQKNNGNNNKDEDPQMVRNEEGLAFGEITPKNRLQNQIRLAKDLFERENNKQIDHEEFHNNVSLRNSIMNFWSEGREESYSAAYRRLEESNWFKNHPELQGDIFMITIDHLDFFMEAEKQGKI